MPLGLQALLASLPILAILVAMLALLWSAAPRTLGPFGGSFAPLYHPGMTLLGAFLAGALGVALADALLGGLLALFVFA